MIYMGTPDFAVTILERLLQAGHEVGAVFTQPDRPKGRGKKCQSPPVADFARAHGLPLYQPTSLKTAEVTEIFQSLAPDIVIVAAYGRIIPSSLLALPARGFLNVHASLLPKYRGAAPIQWALRNGDTETGVSIMQLTAGLDEGPVYKTAALAIEPEWNKKDLFDALAVLGADTLLDTLCHLDALTPQPQDESQATYAPMFGRRDGCVDFHQSARDLVNLNRALLPDDSIYTFINNQRLAFKDVTISDNIENNQEAPGTVIAVDRQGLILSCGEGALCLREVQPAGKKPMTIQAFLNGHPLHVGDRFLNESGEP